MNKHFVPNFLQAKRFGIIPNPTWDVFAARAAAAVRDDAGAV